MQLLAKALALSAILATSTTSLTAHAQQTATSEDSALITARHAAAQGAGYRALHHCTARFSSGIPAHMIESIGSRQSGGEPVIDDVNRTVTVAFADDMEPRIAAWRPGLGCTQLPIGARMDMVSHLPRMPDATRAPELDQQPWPMGDVNATAELPPKQRKAIEAVLDDAFRNQEGPYKGNTWGIAVIRDGKIVAERYAPGWGIHTAARTNSMCKSVSASLVGVGVQKGLIDIHAPAPLKAWREPGDPRGRITINNLLHMASGLYTEGGRDPQSEIYGSGAPASEVSMLNGVDTEPGTRYVYAGSDTILATRAVREAVDNDSEWISFPHRELLWKIGMTRTLLETDTKGDFLTSGQCWSTVRDFARFGLLYLNDGVWRGERILPTGWSDYVNTPAPAQPKSLAPGRSGYGAQFWLYGGAEGLPAVAYSPGGALGQFAMIIPEKKAVIVRRGLDRSEAFAMATFSADVLKALGL